MGSALSVGSSRDASTISVEGKAVLSVRKAIIRMRASVYHVVRL